MPIPLLRPGISCLPARRGRALDRVMWAYQACVLKALRPVLSQCHTYTLRPTEDRESMTRKPASSCRRAFSEPTYLLTPFVAVVLPDSRRYSTVGRYR